MTTSGTGDNTSPGSSIFRGLHVFDCPRFDGLENLQNTGAFNSGGYIVAM
ncbi:MAG: hypothetical protein LBI81_00500 [Puniceicoccales bacterium]|nr:hypothetical protein [Puniceicoccales bacterium]